MVSFEKHAILACTDRPKLLAEFRRDLAGIGRRFIASCRAP
jgi:hypothetical protein